MGQPEILCHWEFISGHAAQSGFHLCGSHGQTIRDARSGRIMGLTPGRFPRPLRSPFVLQQAGVWPGETADNSPNALALVITHIFLGPALVLLSGTPLKPRRGGLFIAAPSPRPPAKPRRGGLFMGNGYA